MTEREYQDEALTPGLARLRAWLSPALLTQLQAGMHRHDIASLTFHRSPRGERLRMEMRLFRDLT